MSDNARGLYGKFRVARNDGSSRPGGKHEHCDHFVLDLTHDKHALPALRAYADSCAAEYPLLAADLRKKLDAAAAPKWQTCKRCDNPTYCREHLRGCDLEEIAR